jgi:hypothetical protein
MKPLSVARMMHAAITAALNYRVQDPYTAKMIDELASGFVNIDRMLAVLWCGEWSGIGLDYSTKKQEALQVVTGKPWSYWKGLVAE